MAQFAQRWILDHEEVSVIIPGATSADQARANASISELPLSQPLHERLANYYQAKVHLSFAALLSEVLPAAFF